MRDRSICMGAHAVKLFKEGTAELAKLGTEMSRWLSPTLMELLKKELPLGLDCEGKIVVNNPMLIWAWLTRNRQHQ